MKRESFDGVEMQSRSRLDQWLGFHRERKENLRMKDE